MLTKEELFLICLHHPEFFPPEGIDKIDSIIENYSKNKTIGIGCFFIDFVPDVNSHLYKMPVYPLPYIENKPVYELWLEITKVGEYESANDEYVDPGFAFSIFVWGMKEEMFSTVLEIESLIEDVSVLKHYISELVTNGFYIHNDSKSSFILIDDVRFYVDAKPLNK